VKLKFAALLVFGCLSKLGYGDPLWQVETDEIERIAIQAVHNEYPQLPLNDLKVETGVTVMCDGNRTLDQYRDRPPRQYECQAMVSVVPQSTVIERRYTDEKGKCRLIRTREPISVHVFEDRTTTVGGLGATSRGDHSVDCPEDIADIGLLRYNNSLMRTP